LKKPSYEHEPNIVIVTISFSWLYSESYICLINRH